MSIIKNMVIVTMIAALLLVACNAPVATTTSPAAPSPTVPAAQKTYEFKYATPYPEPDDMQPGIKYMIEQMPKRTNNRVKITPYYNGTLGKVTDHLTMLDTGVADFAQVMPDMFEKVFAVPAMLIIGALNIPNSKATIMEIAYTLYNTGLMKKDFEKYKLLLFEGTDSAGVAFKSKVTTLAELQKLKIRTAPGSFTNQIKAMGASAVSIPAGDVYMALDRGTADALVTMPGSFLSWKANEITKYWCKFNMGIGVNMFLMSQEKWNSLPSDIQVVWEQVNNEAKYYFLDEMDRLYPSLDERFTKNGVTTYSLSAEEEAKWLALIQPVLAEYIATYQAQGFPVKEAAAKVQQVVSRYKSK